MSDTGTDAVSTIWTSLDGAPDWLARLQILGEGALPSVFAVTDLAAASVGAACLAMAEFIAACGGRPAQMPAQVTVDRRLASLWFGRSIRPQGWDMAPPWDAVAGDYTAEDGWIRLHTNAPQHRHAALAVLETEPEREHVAQAVRRWRAEALESAIVERGGCAAAMRGRAEWATHPQGRAVSGDPLVIHSPGRPGPTPKWRGPASRPLQGIRVLDLTRVLAGPVATRFLAGFGADVLRIDPPDWDELGVVPDVVLGKRCARLNLRLPNHRAVWEGLLRQSDVLVHGYRPGALDGLGLDAVRRHSLCPGLVDVSLDAYGWSGPWQGRRGFDSLVQMSSGSADAGMRQLGRDRPTPLPAQALDHAPGYIKAAAAIRGPTRRVSWAGIHNTVRLATDRIEMMGFSAMRWGRPRNAAIDHQLLPDPTLAICK
jgi:hypothetical protein